MIKKCPFCAEEILVDAKKCKHCGEYLDEKLAQSSAAHQWKPGTAAVLSLIIPGAGQMYKGEVFAGMCWLFVVPIGYCFVILPGVILHIICIASAASGNPKKDGKTTKSLK